MVRACARALGVLLSGRTLGVGDEVAVLHAGVDGAVCSGATMRCCNNNTLLRRRHNDALLQQ